MMRADAIASVHSDARWGFARAATEGGARRHVWSSRVQVASLILLVAIIFIISGSRAMLDRETALRDAAEDLEMTSMLVASALDVASAERVRAPAAGSLLPGRVFARGRRVLVSDAAGALIAAWPGGFADREMLADRLGRAQALTTFADKAGVMRIVLADGSEALATVRDRAAGRGQIAIIHPIREALSDWRTHSINALLVILVAVALIGLLALGYTWQRGRRRDAAEMVLTMRERMVSENSSRRKCWSEPATSLRKSFTSVMWKSKDPKARTRTMPKSASRSMMGLLVPHLLPVNRRVLT